MGDPFTDTAINDVPQGEEAPDDPVNETPEEVAEPDPIPEGLDPEPMSAGKEGDTE